MDISEPVRAVLRQWGSKGGRERAKRLSPEVRRRIAGAAAAARWKRASDAVYAFPGTGDLGEIAPNIIGGSMTGCAVRESLRLVS